jgi:DtxR family Mn-dependent transcriptional regulator
VIGAIESMMMPNPANALLIFAAAMAMGCLLLWPARGLLWQLLRTRRARQRILIEDALKHLYDCQYHARAATLQSLAGALGISGNRASELINALEALRLVRTTKDGLELSAEGCRYALQLIRVHRLWEQYLAERTGMAATAWHAEADRREHLLSPDEVENLATKLGHPRYDPHGDAIPSATGEIAPAIGQPLASLAEGDRATIVHVEDEPEAVYTQLVAKNLVPGLRVRVIENSPERVCFSVDGEEHSLPPVVAANLTVVPRAKDEETEEPLERLSALRPGQKGTVARISLACRGVQLRRLLDLGFVPGTVVEAELPSPSGDPTAYRVRGSLIALRKEQADLICISRSENGAPKP